MIKSYVDMHIGESNEITKMIEEEKRANELRNQRLQWLRTRSKTVSNIRVGNMSTELDALDDDKNAAEQNLGIP